MDYEQSQEFQMWLYARKRASGAPPDVSVNTAQQPEPNTTPRHSLRHFTQKLFWKSLDAWQLDLCDRLENVSRSRGRRILIHSMPQVGKTIIVSQRFPAYCIGNNPLLRVRLLMYNLTHARQKGGAITKNLMQSSEYARLYPDPALVVPTLSRAEEWRTRARERINDGQATFKCFGLETGATGEGGDLWIIDDPYPSAAHAESEAYNKTVWTAWDGTVKPRLSPDANVVIMFHRYQVGDLAGQLLEKEPGEWELWRYAAIADGDYEVEGTDQRFPCLPLDRPAGTPLSPRYGLDWYESKKKSPRVWLGQFQGRPTAQDGDMFDVSIWRQPGMIVDEDQLPPDLPTARAWDFAATEGGGAASAGIKMAGPDEEGFFYVLDAAVAHRSTAGRMKLIASVAEADGEDCDIGFPQDPGSAGKDTVWFTAQALAGYSYWTFNPKQDKVQRAQPLADSVNIGLVKLVRGSWNGKFIDEFRHFPFGARKDQVDAAADCYKRLSRKTKRRRPRSTSQSVFG